MTRGGGTASPPGSKVKSRALYVGTLPGIRSLFRPLLRSRAVIFVLHRFRNPDLGTDGHDPAVLRRFLASLRRAHYEILDLTEVFRRLTIGEPPLRGAVAFTIDDGYVEQATVAAPLFAEFDCPVTTFVATGFLDRTMWFWWDQVTYILGRTTRPSVIVELGSPELRYDLRGPGARQRASDDLVARCKEVANGTMRRAIARLAEAAEVALPVVAPAEFTPMTWNQLRRCEQSGMRFGPHTVTHPVLSRVSDAESGREVADSWERVRVEATQPVAIFCYPNGRSQDAGPREVKILSALGLEGAVLGVPAYARAAGDAEGIFRVPRFGFPGTVPEAMQLASGLERLKEILRRNGE